MTTNNYSGNKGEWSEIYTLLKLASDKGVFAADSELNRIEDLYYPILKIIRSELVGNFEYNLGSKIIIKNSSGEKIAAFSIKKFSEKAGELLSRIQQASGSSNRFIELESFLQEIHCHTLKAQSSDKKDITLVVHDPVTHYQPSLGFSIKSHLGGDSTLLNASGATNFVFQIDGLISSDEVIDSVNSIDGRSKIQKRVERINELGGVFKFSHISSDIFEQNLRVIDSLLPEILSEMLLIYFSGKNSRVEEIVKNLEELNPCNFSIENNHPFYEYKIKRLLHDVSLGLTPATKWTGVFDATGGYLIVKENGEILCYHIYNANEFQDYLIKNTRLESPSSSRHGYGELYKKKKELLFNLNLQIRFK
jgi:type II restriction enzyme